jgi:hypothetical protein
MKSRNERAGAGNKPLFRFPHVGLSEVELSLEKGKAASKKKFNLK